MAAAMIYIECFLISINGSSRRCSRLAPRMMFLGGVGPDHRSVFRLVLSASQTAQSDWYSVFTRMGRDKRKNAQTRRKDE